MTTPQTIAEIEADLKIIKQTKVDSVVHDRAVKHIETLLALCKQSQTWVAIEEREPEIDDIILIRAKPKDFLEFPKVGVYKGATCGIHYADTDSTDNVSFKEWKSIHDPLPPIPQETK